jgi:hypothetical protein
LIHCPAGEGRYEGARTVSVDRHVKDVCVDWQLLQHFLCVRVENADPAIGAFNNDTEMVSRIHVRPLLSLLKRCSPHIRYESLFSGVPAIYPMKSQYSAFSQALNHPPQRESIL